MPFFFQIDQSSEHSELSGIPYTASTTKLGSLDGGSTRNVNINIIRGGGGDFGGGGGGSPPPPPSPVQIMSNNMQKVKAMEAQVAEQMARTDSELHDQKQRAADLIKAQVTQLSTLLCRSDAMVISPVMQDLIKKQLATAVAVSAKQAADLSNLQVTYFIFAHQS